MNTPATSKPTDGDRTDAPTSPGTTSSNVKGERSPRLPHERDESSDSGTQNADGMMDIAYDDATSGKVPTDRGEATEETYRRHLRDKPGS